MRLKILSSFFLILAAFALPVVSAAGNGKEFGDVVKLIESHYRVKHKSIPFAAKMGMRATQMVARRVLHYAEYGSVKFAYFEDQDFSAPQGGREFFLAMRGAIEPEWQPLVQVRAPKETEQTYVYTKEAGKFFRVLVVQISRRDATVVQVEVSPEKLLELMRDPDAMGKTLTDEASSDTDK
jgi:hypothetical protein